MKALLKELPSRRPLVWENVKYDVLAALEESPHHAVALKTLVVHHDVVLPKEIIKELHRLDPEEPIFMPPMSWLRYALVNHQKCTLMFACQDYDAPTTLAALQTDDLTEDTLEPLCMAMTEMQGDVESLREALVVYNRRG